MTPEMFRKFAALGLSHEQMAGVLEIFEAEAEARKEKARTRVQRWRDKKRDETQRNVTEHNETQQAGSREGVARGLDNLQTQKISGKEEKKDTSPSARSKRGERIPDDFQPDIEAAVSEGLPRLEAERQARSFCDYWRAKPGKEGLKLDWQATWRVWFRRNIPAQPPPRQATAPPSGDFNAILDSLQGKSGNDAHPGPTIDGSVDRADSGGAANLVQLHAISARR